MRIAVILAIALVFVSFIIGIYLYPQMPAQLDSHWNAEGEADGKTGKFTGLFLVPIISLVILLFFLIIPQIDPRKENIKKFKKEYDLLLFVIIAFMFYVYILSIIWNIGFEFNFSLFILPAFTVLFLFIGFVLEKAKPNWFVGIRTPWTLSSEKVWIKTHKRGAKLFKTVAIVSLFGFVFPAIAIWFVIIPAILVALYLVVYSYFVYRKKN